jgi:hypothetical protein
MWIVIGCRCMMWGVLRAVCGLGTSDAPCDVPVRHDRVARGRGFAVAAGFFGYKWLADDEADRSYACGSGSRAGTCFSGETTSMNMTFVFAAVAVVGLVLTVQAVRARTGPRSERHAVVDTHWLAARTINDSHRSVRESH